MRHTRRLIASLVGAAIWFVAASTVAYAQRAPDPVGGGGGDDANIVAPPQTVVSVDTPVWKFVLVAAIAALLALAVVGLINSLRHARASRPSQMLPS